MQDNLSIVITMIIFVTLVVIFPLYNIFERQDDMSYTLALKVTTSFVDEVVNNGYIDLTSYEKYISQLGLTGNSYDVQIEAHRKTLIADVNNPGQFLEQYKIDYTADILKVIDSPTPNIAGSAPNINDAYLLNEDDQIYIKLNNSNTTMAGSVFNAIIPTSKKERIVVNYGGVVKNSSWNKVDSTIHSFTTRPSTPVVTKGGSAVTGATISVEAGVDITFTASSTPSDWWKSITSYIWNIHYQSGPDLNITTPATGVSPTFFTNMTTDFPTTSPCILNVYAVDNYGESSNIALVTINTFSTTPGVPTLSSVPDTINTNVVAPDADGSTSITFTALSDPNSTWKTIAKYVWTIQNAGGTPYTRETVTGTMTEEFANGVGSVRVYAVDTGNIPSGPNGTGFTVMNNFMQQAISGVGIAKLESVVIPGATVKAYSFEVRVRDGHSGNDWWRVTGLLSDGVTWENINPGGDLSAENDVSNGVTTGNITIADPNKYIQLRFEYSVDAGHAHCLNENPYIKYSVQYKFQPII